MRKSYRHQLLICGAIVVMSPTVSYAQSEDEDAQSAEAAADADADSDAQSDSDEPAIVVTGTRIRQDGFNAPTPVTVLGTADLEAQKSANIQDIVLTLPVISQSGSTTPQGSTGGFSGGNFGISSANLRGLGGSRTLILLDGRRTVASNFGGTVDANTFPQGLISRVEIVTGGASAQYGSDAVGGVVNYILEQNFKGFKLGGSAGITTYGDGFNYDLEATAGFSLFDDRLHIALNGEYSKQELIDAPFRNRAWNKTGYQQMDNPDWTPTNGLPRRIVATEVGLSLMTEGGLITQGPLMGTYFLPDGATASLNYGRVGGPWMIGGDWKITNEGANGNISLLPQEERIGIFNRVSFDVTPDISIYGQFSWNRWSGTTIGGLMLATYGTPYTIQRDNAYLIQNYPHVVAAMTSAGQTNIRVGTYGNITNGIDNSREVFRYTAGARGDFSLLARPWSFDAYFHHGVTKTHEELYNVAHLARRTLALDAVFSGGNIVCRSTLTAPTNGCQPLNFLGGVAPSSASLAYVFGVQPTREQTIKLDVAALDFSGELFDLPGGTVAIAFGGEWRQESIDGEVSPCCGYETGNYIMNVAKDSVKEAFLELSLPLLPGLDFNPAARITDYSTSGTVTTWKVGATYSPIPDIKFRGSYSRDIRAPNLSELFNAGSTGQTSFTMPPNSPTPGLVNARNQTVGNPNLKPERATTLTAGVVLTPSFFPGFSASVDYYDIKIKDGIGSLGNAQQRAEFCWTDNLPQFCDSFIFENGVLVTVRNQPVNFSVELLRGFEFEGSYRTPLSAISENLPGVLSIRASVNHPTTRTSDNLVLLSNTVGQAATPHWTYRISTFYDIDPFSFNLTIRGQSGGVLSNSNVECVSSCPVSTSTNITVNDNHRDGSIYFDGSVKVRLPFPTDDTSLSFIVRNIFNRPPELTGNGFNAFFFNYPEADYGNYDIIGRTFRVALTTRF